jgi:Protein of unknown function (DUF3592)
MPRPPMQDPTRQDWEDLSRTLRVGAHRRGAPSTASASTDGWGVVWVLLGCVGLLMGLLMVPFLLYANQQHRHLLEHGVVTQATVTGRPDYCRRICYAYVRFTTPAGPQAGTVPAGRNERFPPGATVTIRYDPADPSRLERVDDTDVQYFTFMLCFFAGLGLFCLVIGIVLVASES